MRPNFEYYMGKLDDWPFEVGVDLSLRERAPIAERPHRIHLRFELNHASTDGLSTKEEDALLAFIEDQVLETLDENVYTFVSTVTHRKARTLVLYASCRPDDDPAIQKALDEIETHSTKVICEDDPQWTEYTEVLYPCEEMMHQIQDKRVLRQFEKQGDDSAEIRAIEPRFIGMKEERARALAKRLEEQGYGVGELAATEAGTWAVTGQVQSPLALAILDDFRHTWLAIAREFEGTYQGWSAEVVPVSGKNNNTGLGGHLNDVHDELALPGRPEGEGPVAGA